MPPKPKILLLCDDLRQSSGIATMAREFVKYTSNAFDWVQLGAAIRHPDHGKVFDVSKDIESATGYKNVSAKIYAHDGYGNPEVLRELFAIEKPDAIMHFTDPRFWEWLYLMEHEIRCNVGIPIMYYNIWDCPPAPFWNKPFYQSCDLIMNISKQTHILVKMVLGKENYYDMDSNTGDGDILLKYVPHGIDDGTFYPINENSPDYNEFKRFSEEFKKAHDIDFIVFWNNRNVRRKQPGDVVLAYKVFCDKLSEEKRKRVALLMHTTLIDEHGTNLPEVVRVICPNYKVIFNDERLTPQVLNFFYNISDVTLNISSNEGFGLATAESVMAGTPIAVNVTGGLQDQCGFMDENGDAMEFDEMYTSNHTGICTACGVWAKPIFPSNRSLQGSVPTPYIFDDRCNFNDVADVLMEWYDLSSETRKHMGKIGREWMRSEMVGMSSKEMAKRMIVGINECISKFKRKPKFSVYKVDNIEKIENCGIVW